MPSNIFTLCILLRNSDVQVLTKSLKTRAQDYLKSFKKLRDEFDTKDKDS